MIYVLIFGGIIATIVIYIFHDKNKEISLLKKDISLLKNDIETLQKLHQQEISKLEERLKNSHNLRVQECEFSDIILSYAWSEVSQLFHKEYTFLDTSPSFSQSVGKNNTTLKNIACRIQEAIDEQYKYRYISFLYPELENIFDGMTIKISTPAKIDNISLRSENLIEVVNLLSKNPNQAKNLILLKNRVSFLESTQSNLTAIPYMAEIMADYETYGLEHLAKELDWGYAAKRMDKVKSIREIRRDAKTIVERNKEAQYQLGYLLKLYPNLEDVIDVEFKQLPIVKISELPEHDSVRDFLSNEEYAKLSTTERNQLALDRYKASHNLSNWQIGRDYEMFVGYRYEQQGYNVDRFGSYMRLEDLGRDLIAKKGKETLIIQCKYWSTHKQIHENHINQLYGTTISYCIEHNVTPSTVKGILITNTELSPVAKKMASYLGIKYIEHYEKGEYPCIKCNIGHDEYGVKTKIYHLPFDQQYDVTQIKNKGEFYATTVAEAEAAGFRRAFKWFGSRNF